LHVATRLACVQVCGCPECVGGEVGDHAGTRHRVDHSRAGRCWVQAVVRALCSAFPLDSEPAACNAEVVSENECKPGGVGYDNCHNG
jgi:hypothetical protein